MNDEKRTQRKWIVTQVLLWGALWGIFEATVGYLLHLVSFGYSWLILYPFACFFMSNVYRKTGRTVSVALVGCLCACIKMLNLLLPGRVDKVTNPAFSILFEALAMAVVIFAFRRLKRKNPFVKALAALAMDTGWRALFALYLLFLVPDWMQEVSIVSSAPKFIPFFITQNLITSALLFIGYQFMSYIHKPIILAERRLLAIRPSVPSRLLSAGKIAGLALLLLFNVALELLL